MINQLMGGLAVMPWEVDEVSDEWMCAMSAMVEDLPKMYAALRKQEANRELWLKKNNYRGYLKKRK